jgi:hypothetical protein
MDKEETANTIRWIENIPLSRGTGKLEKDFSDAVKMAELLKYYYPRYVDLHNYSPVLKRASKIDNWATLNKKVLSKLDIRISDEVTEKLASGAKGEILNLLTKVRLRILKSRGEELECKSARKEKASIPSGALCSKGNKNEKVQYLTILKKKDQELAEKEELIKTLTQTVSHLEIQLHMKNKNINNPN